MTELQRTVGDLNVSRETYEKLDAFAGLLAKWTKSINLIGESSVPHIWDRHIVDSAQIFSYAPQNWKSWTDIGSGGGLPALVISIVDPENRPILLIESDQRKCLFLNTVRRELDLNISVINGRIEQQEVPKSDVLTARALAPLVDLLGLSETLLSERGTAIFPKGESFQSELDNAKLEWDFDHVAHSSKTHPDAKVLEVTRIRRRER